MPNRVAFFIVLSAASIAAAAPKSKARSEVDASIAAEEEALLATIKTPRQRNYARLVIDSGRPPSLMIDDLQGGNIKEGAMGELTQIAVGHRIVQGAGRFKIDKAFREPTHAFSIDQISDRHNAVVGDFNLWLEGIDTKGMVDNQEADFAGVVFEVSGTKRYATANGSQRTIRKLIVLDLTEANKVIQQVRALRAYRVWEDKSGDFAVRAKFVAFADGDVELLKPDGRELKVPIKKLSPADQKWVRDQVKASKAKPAGAFRGERP